MASVYSQRLPLGWKAPAFSLPSTDGSSYSLADVTKPGLLVVFTCNHCPYAQAAWPLLVELHEKYSDDVQFVAINPNDADTYPEDGIEGMKDLVLEHGVPFPYLRDESQEVARSYQAVCTPDPYLFKNEGGGVFSLVYHGRINDNWQYPDQVVEHSLDHALHNVVSDGDPLVDQKPSVGCSIKWLNQES